MNNFFQTMMGKKFFEGTLPKIAHNLERIADSLEKQNSQPEKSRNDVKWEKMKEKTKELIDDSGSAAEKRIFSGLLEYMEDIEKEE